MRDFTPQAPKVNAPVKVLYHPLPAGTDAMAIPTRRTVVVSTALSATAQARAHKQALGYLQAAACGVTLPDGWRVVWASVGQPGAVVWRRRLVVIDSDLTEAQEQEVMAAAQQLINNTSTSAQTSLGLPAGRSV